MATGHGHLLQLAFTTLIADRAIVRMIGHRPLDDMFAQLHRIRIGR